MNHTPLGGGRGCHWLCQCFGHGWLMASAGMLRIRNRLVLVVEADVADASLYSTTFGRPLGQRAGLHWVEMSGIERCGKRWNKCADSIRQEESPFITPLLPVWQYKLDWTLTKDKALRY
jgi:hypothetical protein